MPIPSHGAIIANSQIDTGILVASSQRYVHSTKPVICADKDGPKGTWTHEYRHTQFPA